MTNTTKFKYSLISLVFIFTIFTICIFILPLMLHSSSLTYIKTLSDFSALYNVILSIILGFFTLYITYLLAKIPTAIAKKENAIALHEKRWKLYESLSKNFNKIDILKPLLNEDFQKYTQIKEMQKNGVEKRKIDFEIVTLPFSNSPEHLLNLLLEFFDSDKTYLDCMNSIEADHQKIKQLGNINVADIEAMSPEKLDSLKQQLLWDELEKMRLRRKIQIILKKAIADMISKKKFECTEIQLLYDLDIEDEKLINQLKENLDSILPNNLAFFKVELNPDYHDENSYMVREEVIYKFLTVCNNYASIYHLIPIMEKALKISNRHD